MENMILEVVLFALVLIATWRGTYCLGHYRGYKAAMDHVRGVMGKQKKRKITIRQG